MTATAFDTLAYANKLKMAGVEPKIAEAQSEATAEILHNLIIEQLATKNDLKNLKVEICIFIAKALSWAIGALVGILTIIQLVFHFWK